MSKFVSGTGEDQVLAIHINSKYNIMKIRNIAFAALCVGMLGMVSCSDDKENEPANGSVSVIDGTRITSIGDVTYSYDEEGRCNRVRAYGEDVILIDYATGVMTLPEDGEVVDMGDYKVSFNKEGYIKTLKAEFSGNEDGVKFSAKGNIEVTYSGDGKVKEINGKVTAEASAGGQHAKMEQISTAKYTWSNGNITKVVQEITATGDEIDMNHHIEVTLEYGDEKNPYQQHTFGVAAYSMPATFAFLAPVGLVGKGTENLPTYGEVTGYGSDNNSAIEYTLNENGSIATETFMNETFRYTYEGVGGVEDVLDSRSGKTQKTADLIFKTFFPKGIKSLIK